MEQTLGYRIKEELLERLDFSRELTDEEVMNEIEERVLNLNDNEYISITEKKDLCIEIFNSVRRLGILQQLIDDESISEIMVNGPDNIFIERDGKIGKFEGKIASEEELEDIIQQIVAKVNRTVNEAEPIVDARLSDGSRVNVVLPPIAINGAVVTIRKFPKIPMTMERLLEFGTLTTEAAGFIKILMETGCNIIVSGGTSSGKTSFLNALADYIPKKERVIIIEDSAELQLSGIPNLVQMETRNANVEGKGEIGIGDLIKSSLRMRPDRILVGEVRDGKAAIMLLNAFNTGHYGESTIHANSASDTISRLETLVLTGSNIPLDAAKRQIVSAIDYIIYLGRLKDGKRRVLEISELCEAEGNIYLNQIFGYEPELGLKRCGNPKRMAKFEMAGVKENGLFKIQKD
ncbi:MAG: CpaF family protein [Catonella sp.]